MSANKAKGTAWESAVVKYLGEQGHTARRVVQMGRLDQGDVHVNDLAVIEAKNTAKHDFPGFIRQANQEAKNAGLSFGVAVVKKRGANVKDAFVVMDLATFAEVLHRIN